ncbi:multidrug effflux MFS transporter, partial [Pseudomonas aeruginosa]|nr:multidrug effflux MFS transporter [Pseudomonas aeruginosa]
RISVESVVRCSWNGWPDDRGIRSETHPADRRASHSAGQVVLAYGKLVLDKRFILPALSMSLLMSGLFASFGAAPIILMEGFSLSAVQAGLYFAATVFVVFAAGMAAPRLAHHYGPANITVLGIACAMIGGILLFAGPANPSMWSYVRVRPVKSS